MTIGNYTVSDPPTRSSVWKMFVEAWGYLTGGIGMTDISSAVKLLERQVAFYEAGHNHNATTDAGGKPLVLTSVRKRNFDLQDCDVLWGNYYAPRVDGGVFEHVFAVVAGSGSCDLHSTTTSMAYGTVTFDYNPFDTTWATTAACQLDLRNLTAINTAAPFNTNWTVVMAYPTPCLNAGGIENRIINHAFGFDTNAASAPYFRFGAKTASTATLSFDYLAVVRMLA